MSVQKKLETLANNDSIIKILPGNLHMSILRREVFMKQKEAFQVSSDREITVQNFGYGQTGSFRVREVATRNFIMEITLANGTYVLPNNWAMKLVKRIREKVGGENEIVKHGWANAVQTYRECVDMETRDKLSLLSEGNGVSLTNPSAPIVGYVFLNIAAASINPKLAQYYPNYQLNQSAEYEIEFAESADVIVSGTAPAIQKCRILYEYAAPLKNRVLRSKFDQGTPGQAGFIEGGEKLMFHEIVSYEYPLGTTGNTSRSQTLRSFPTSEIDELVFFFVNSTDITTNKNNLLTQKLTDIKLTMSDREIIDAQNDFQEFKQLFRNYIPNKFKIGGSEKNFYTLDLSPLNYVKQESNLIMVQGVVLSEEDLLLEFKVPSDVAGTLFIYGVKKQYNEFKNGNLKRFY